MNCVENDAGKQTDKLIAQLREAISARDDFLAIAMHELRNPLTPILLCLQLIRMAEESNDRARTISELERLERQIKHFIARTNMLLEVARTRSGKLSLEPSRFNLSDGRVGNRGKSTFQCDQVRPRQTYRNYSDRDRRSGPDSSS